MARVVVLGSSGYDLTIRLSRLPRPGETLLGGTLLRGPGGKGANAAMAARKAGAEVTFLTSFGDDDFGRELIEHDGRAGLDLSHAKKGVGVPNQVALILVGQDGQNLIAVAPGASDQLRPEEIERLPSSVFRAGDVFLGCLEVPCETVVAGLRRARQAGMTTILNPAPADPAIIGAAAGLVDVLTPNQEEAAILSGQTTDTIERAADAGRELGKRIGAEVVVTLGESGCVILDRTGATQFVPAPRVAVVDTVGAGDAFNGALAVALAEARPLVEAAAWAAAAGALAVTRPGAQGATPSREEIDALMSLP